LTLGAGLDINASREGILIYYFLPRRKLVAFSPVFSRSNFQEVSAELLLNIFPIEITNFLCLLSVDVQDSLMVH